MYNGYNGLSSKALEELIGKFPDDKRADSWRAALPAARAAERAAVPAPVTPPKWVSKPKPTEEERRIYPEWVINYPNIGLAAVNCNHGRAWYVWLVCKALDQEHTGRIDIDQLRAYLAHLGIGGRQQRRWIADAKRTGLISEAKGVYYHVGPLKAAQLLKCKDIWHPARMKLADLGWPGWHKYLWAAFLATLGGKSISQVQKWKITGVEPRVQRLYQSPDENLVSLSYPTYNYATSHVSIESVPAIRELRGWNLFIRGDEVIQRLPDGRVVHPDIAEPVHSGKRTRRLRAALTSLQTEMGGGAVDRPSEQPAGNDAQVITRLFHSTNDRARSYIKRRISNIFPDDRPWDVFAKVNQRGRVTNWEAVAV